MTPSGTYSVVDGSPVSAADARRLWSDAAREVLMDTACRYNAVITYGELGEAVQQQAGIRTRSLLQHWIGKVLGQAALRCAQDGELLMTALCVKADGTVGHGYADAVRLTGQPAPRTPKRTPLTNALPAPQVRRGPPGRRRHAGP